MILPCSSELICTCAAREALGLARDLVLEFLGCSSIFPMAISTFFTRADIVPLVGPGDGGQFVIPGGADVI
jgi:hypothetical protein